MQDRKPEPRPAAAETRDTGPIPLAERRRLEPKPDDKDTSPPAIEDWASI